HIGQVWPAAAPPRTPALRVNNTRADDVGRATISTQSRKLSQALSTVSPVPFLGRSAKAELSGRSQRPQEIGARGPALRETHTMVRRPTELAATLFGAGSLREPLDREFHGCNLVSVGTDSGFTIAGLFAGIGGVERGLAGAGGRAELLCEWWEPAKVVLAQRFPDASVVGDVRDLRSLPKVDVATAGFACTDLSQAGRTHGIQGSQSGLVAEVFRLLRRQRVPVLVLENVRNMLVLDGGEAMRYLTAELESLGYRWAYRLVDSRFAGVPQRRQRVLFVAARDVDPRAILFADDAGEPPDDRFRDDCF